MSFLDAKIVDGPNRGWPLRAAIAINQGANLEDVRAGLIAEIEAKIEVLRAEAERIRGLKRDGT